MSQQSGETVVFLEAFATGQDLLGGGPSYAKVGASNHFTAQLVRLQSLCEKNALTEVRILYAPDMWGPDGVEDEMRMESPELVVTKTDFWFTDRGRHSDGIVETRTQNMKELFALLARTNGPIYLGSNLASVERDVMDDLPAEEEPEAYTPR